MNKFAWFYLQINKKFDMIPLLFAQTDFIGQPRYTEVSSVAREGGTHTHTCQNSEAVSMAFLSSIRTSVFIYKREALDLSLGEEVFGIFYTSLKNKHFEYFF